MKVQYEYDGHPRLINFTITESSNGFLCKVKTTKDIEKLNEILDFSDNKNIIEQTLKKHIQDIIELPLLFDRDYDDDGYNFKLRLDLLVKKLG